MADLYTIITQTTLNPREWQGTNVVARAQFILPQNMYQVGGLAPMFGASDPCLDDFELCMPVFASSVQTDDFYNDYTRLLAFNLSAVNWTLQKLTGGVFVNVENPIAAPTGVVASPQLFYYSLVLSWREVLLAYGEGTYRVTSNGLSTLSYVLKEFSCENAIGTFKLKTTNKGKYTDETRDFIIPFVWEDEIRYYGEMRLATDAPFRNDLRFSEFESADRIVKNTVRKTYRALFHKGINPLFERYVLFGFSGIDSEYTDYYSANQEHIVSRVLVGDTTQGYTADIATNLSYKFEARLLSKKDLGYRNELEN